MGSKAENREKRKREKQEREDREKEKFLSRTIPVLQNQQVRSEFGPNSKEARINVDPNIYKESMFRWDTSIADREGQWHWKDKKIFEDRDWNDDEYNSVIFPRLSSLGHNTWGQVEIQTYDGAGRRRNRLNKYQSVDSVCPQAQDRLLEKNLLDYGDFFFRLREGSFRRIWGFRIKNQFIVIWYERHHQICPLDD